MAHDTKLLTASCEWLVINEGGGVDDAVKLSDGWAPALNAALGIALPLVLVTLRPSASIADAFHGVIVHNCGNGVRYLRYQAAADVS